LIARVAGPSSPNTFAPEPSWKFVPVDYIFPSISAPGSFNNNFPMSRLINSLSGDYCNEDFVGIKLGDLNLSNNPSDLQENVSTRSLSHVLLFSDSITVRKELGKEVEFQVKIKSSDFHNVKDFQIGITWDSLVIEYLSYSTDEFTLPVSELTNLFIDDGVAQNESRIYLGWYDPNFEIDGINLSHGHLICELNFKLKDQDNSSVEFNQDPLIEAFYTNKDNRRVPISIEFLPIKVETVSSNSEFDISNQFKVFPSLAKSYVQINTDVTEAYTYSIFDLAGRRMLHEKVFGDTKIDLSLFKSSTYLLRINNIKTGGEGWFKIIKMD
jgi:hypothetical protein